MDLENVELKNPIEDMFLHYLNNVKIETIVDKVYKEGLNGYCGQFKLKTTTRLIYNKKLIKETITYGKF